MNDMEILRQLLNGNHLNSRELERAKDILYMLKVNLDDRKGMEV